MNNGSDKRFLCLLGATMRNYHYIVLYTTVARQDDLCKLIREYLPDGRGVVFCPMMETYRRDAGKAIVLKYMFPGYVFIRSDLKVNEFHDIILAHREVSVKLDLRCALGVARGEGIIGVFAYRKLVAYAARVNYRDGGSGKCKLSRNIIEHSLFLSDV